MTTPDDFEHADAPAPPTAEADIGVLVVEDEVIAAKAHAQYIRRIGGFELVGIAKSGGQALAAMTGKIVGLDPSRIQLILLDMNLGDAHGVQLLRTLRSRRVQVDVIAVTASRDMRVVQAALSLGVVQYIIKPFTFPIFESKLEAYREFRKQLAPDCDAVTQNSVDAVIASLAATPPKSAVKAVPEAMQSELLLALEASTALSSAEAGEAVGVSRVTARRYLEALADSGVVERRPRYGSAGRPVLEYLLIEE